MMINKANRGPEMDNTKDGIAPVSPVPVKESGYIDVANVEMHCHILIKDKDTGEVLVNKRG